MLNEWHENFSAATWLAAHQKTMTKAMFPNDGAPDIVRATKLVEKPERVVVRLEGDDLSVIAKGFNPTVKNGVDANLREVLMLQQLASTDLSPKLIGYSKANHWLMMDFVPGRRLDKVINAQNAPEYAYALGRWYRSYTDAVTDHGVDEPSNWFDYLENIKILKRQDSFDRFRELLEPLEVEKRVVAKGDGGLHNFLINLDGDLIGYDFERSTLKPLGWDVLGTAAYLAILCPENAQGLIDALLDGWRGGTDKIKPSEFRALVQLFVAMTAGRAKTV